MARRFIPLTEVSEILDISSDQAYALVRSGDLRWSSPSSGPDPNHLAHRRRTTLTASKGMITRPRTFSARRASVRS